MGSRSTIDLAYIAGFLDGDGSLMMQIKKRRDGKQKIRFMLTICFYQDSRHEKPLFWIRDVFGIGYLSRRNDKITELRINGFNQVRRIIGKLLPYLKFKKVQAENIYQAADLLISKKINQFTRNELLKLVDIMISIQNHNYATKSKRTKSELFDVLGLTP